MNNLATSYLLWLGWFFGLAGLHRFYNKKFVTGFLWLFTYGFFGFGQFIDLLLMPNMVEEHNLKVRAKLGLSPTGIPLEDNLYHPTLIANYEQGMAQPLANNNQAISQEQLMVKLAQIAEKRGGKISVTQAVIDTGVSFAQVQKTLNEMVKQGYVVIDNHPHTGVVVYDFLELS